MEISKKVSEKQKVIIDVDTGVDDAQALMMAIAASDKLDIIAVTCVAGNTDVDQTCYNTLRVLKVCNRTEIPVYKGAHSALIGTVVDAKTYHGQDGLGDAPDTDPPEINLLRSEHAVNAIIRLVNENKSEIRLVCLGPLTNIALALRIDSKLGENIKDTVIMGGNIEGKGNIVPSAEFNFYCDPESASVVLRDLKCPIKLLSWESCLENGIDWEWYEKMLCKADTPKSLFHSSITKLSTKRKTEIFKSQLYYSCDPTAMVIAINPKAVKESKHAYCTIELCGKITRGQMVVDWRGQLGCNPNVEIVTKVDLEEVKRRYVAMLS